MSGNLLKAKRRSNHAPDGLRPHGEPDGLIPAPIDRRDDTGPHSLKHHTRNLLRPDPSQGRLPTAERLGELLRVTASRLTMPRTRPSCAEPDLNLYAAPPSALPPSMVDDVASGDAPGAELQSVRDGWRTSRREVDEGWWRGSRERSGGHTVRHRLGRRVGWLVAAAASHRLIYLPGSRARSVHADLPRPSRP